MNLKNVILKIEIKSKRSTLVANGTIVNVAIGFRENKNKPLMKQVLVGKNEIQLLNSLASLSSLILLSVVIATGCS